MAGPGRTARIRAQKRSVGQEPNPNGLAVRAGHRPAACSINSCAVDPAGMHTGVNGQDLPV